MNKIDIFTAISNAKGGLIECRNEFREMRKGATASGEYPLVFMSKRFEQEATALLDSIGEFQKLYFPDDGAEG